MLWRAGPIPVELADLIGLVRLELDGNELSGEFLSESTANQHHHFTLHGDRLAGLAVSWAAFSSSKHGKHPRLAIVHWIPFLTRVSF